MNIPFYIKGNSLSILIVIVLAMAIAGCGGSDSQEDTTAEETPAPKEPAEYVSTIVPIPDGLVGTTMPHFKGLTLSDGTVSHDQLLGKPSVLYFWDPACATCVLQIEGLDAVTDVYSPDLVNYVSICGERKIDLRLFLDSRQWRWEHAYLGETIFRRFNITWSVPTILICDAQNQIVAGYTGGPIDERVADDVAELLQKEIAKALGESE